MLSKAQNLPFAILVDIFLYSSVEGNAIHNQGGSLVGWDSFETTLPYSSVCKDWKDAGQFVLYRSIAVLGGESAQLFLRTSQLRPDLAAKVRSLVIGLDEMTEHDTRDVGQAEDSLKVVEVLKSCANVEQLQVQPLHECVRSILLPIIFSRPLRSLVCAPRLRRIRMSGPSGSLYTSSDIRLAVPSLRELELDLWAEQVALPVPLPDVPPLRIEKLRLHADLADVLLFRLWKSTGETLQVLDLYFERLLPIEETTQALQPSVNTVKSIRFVTNPPLDELERFRANEQPIFDRLLPTFERLERLFVTSTDISFKCFRLLPACLHHLEIQAYNHHSAFVYDEDMIDALHDNSIDFTLKSLTLYDARSVWHDDHIEAFRAALASRNINFYFYPDKEASLSDPASDD